jgi:hypothetical protein
MWQGKAFLDSFVTTIVEPLEKQGGSLILPSDESVAFHPQLQVTLFAITD